jgi:hypothetical protein
VAHTLGDCWIDRVLADVPLDSKVIRIRALVFFKCTALDLVLMRSIPRSQDDFTAPAHSLRVGRHHGNGTEIVQHVFSCDGLGSNTGLGERYVFWDVARQVVADHEHIQMLV